MVVLIRRGVPSSNMNVTQGFLPMALGFDNGGDVSLYDAVVKTIAKYLISLKTYLKVSLKMTQSY